MKYLIPGWIHQPGVHCASTALADAFTFHGHPLSEAMCFGLGCGLGFAYLEGNFLTPTRMTATRSRLLEPRFFQHLGRPFQWLINPSPEDAWEQARQYLHAGLPVLLRADLAYLPYYGSRTHFSGHVILLWGYDDEAGEALVADTHFEGLQAVPYASLAQARYSGMGYLQNTGEHYPVKADPFPSDLRPALKQALLQQADDLLGLKIDLPGAFGLAAMKKAAQAMAAWDQAQDWKWAARWFYQVIERRGTGGGAFRLLYSRFLKEATELLPALEPIASSEEMAGIAAAWTKLAFQLKEISEGDDPRPLGQAGRTLAAIAQREENFFRRVRKKTASLRAG